MELKQNTLEIMRNMQGTMKIYLESEIPPRATDLASFIRKCLYEIENQEQVEYIKTHFGMTYVQHIPVEKEKTTMEMIEDIAPLAREMISRNIGEEDVVTQLQASIDEIAEKKNLGKMTRNGKTVYIQKTKPLQQSLETGKRIHEEMMKEEQNKQMKLYWLVIGE